ncbi:MAG: aminotransferase class I/II-fold pyridoxal phosphate-dependent enzyme [Nitrospinae bacterium]|nr:aminotransferase class I/II-fold pyridoxal phosphate-dependent enzyme [Nitrospinota bacterium]
MSNNMRRDERTEAKKSLSPPIFQTATFTFDSADELEAFHSGEKDAFFYSRYGNPTNEAAEKRLARLEGAEASLLYASGMAAISSVFLSLLAPKARMVIPQESYRHTRDIAEGLLIRYGVCVDVLAENSVESLEALPDGPVRVLFAEIPSNPTLRIPDIGKMAEWAQKRRARFIVDSTVASPALFRPLEHGADLAIQSATKYIGGHNDVVAGAVSGGLDIIDALREQQALLGSILGPQEAFLVERGLKTLELRVRRISDTALKLAEFLAGHPNVSRVHYPGLESHPDHQRAVQYMTAFGGIVSFELEGDPDKADELVNTLQIPVLAPGFGGTESQVEHHVKMAYADIGIQGAENRGITAGLIRYSVGLEDFEVLRDDLGESLKKL